MEMLLVEVGYITYVVLYPKVVVLVRLGYKNLKIIYPFIRKST